MHEYLEEIGVNEMGEKGRGRASPTAIMYKSWEEEGGGVYYSTQTVAAKTSLTRGDKCSWIRRHQARPRSFRNIFEVGRGGGGRGYRF